MNSFKSNAVKPVVLRMKVGSCLAFVASVVLFCSMMVDSARGEKLRRSISLARLELAGLEKLGIVDLFNNFVRGVEKTFLSATKKRRFEPTPTPTQPVFVVHSVPDLNSSRPVSESVSICQISVRR